MQASALRAREKFDRRLKRVIALGAPIVLERALQYFWDMRSVLLEAQPHQMHHTLQVQVSSSPEVWGFSSSGNPACKVL